MTDSYARLQRSATILAAFFSLILTIAPPLGYFLIAMQYQQGILDAQATVNSRLVAEVIWSNPDMWRFEEVRLKDLLGRRNEGDHPESRRLYNLQGELIVASNMPLPWPLQSGSNLIFDAGKPVARVEITRSLLPEFVESLEIAVCSIIMSLLFYVLLRVLPLKAVRNAYQGVEKSEHKYRSLFNSMHEGVALYAIRIGETGEESYFELADINRAGEELLCSTREKLLGEDLYQLLGVSGDDDFLRLLQLAGNNERVTLEVVSAHLHRHFRLSVIVVEQDLAALLFEDITEQKTAANRIEKLAYFDNLTGLPNRLLLTDRMKQIFARAAREHFQIALLFIDLDNFKLINDSLGHDFGDCVLQEAARRMQQIVRTSDTVARIGGDEFVIVVACKGQQSAPAHVAQNVINSLAPPILIDDREVFLSASIGIAMYPKDADDRDTLFRYADMAMYAVKGKGRNGYNFYSEEMNRNAHELMELITGLRQAIDREELFLEFQPMVDGNGAIVAAEVLARWQHPEKGLIMPGTFIPVAEDSGLIIPLGEWLLRTVCSKMREWIDSGLPQVVMSINISGRQFQEENFVSQVQEILETAGIEPRYLELELTETALMNDVEVAISSLTSLKEFGLQLVIDDFGTGYCSFGYLKNFPIDHLKIDRSFVQGSCTSTSDRIIVEAVIAIAEKFNIGVIAEGVETAEQLELLSAVKCDRLQGFHFYRPMGEDRFIELLAGLKTAS